MEQMELTFHFKSCELSHSGKAIMAFVDTASSEPTSFWKQYCTKSCPHVTIAFQHEGLDGFEKELTKARSLLMHDLRPSQRKALLTPWGEKSFLITDPPGEDSQRSGLLTCISEFLAARGLQNDRPLHIETRKGHTEDEGNGEGSLS